MSDADRSQSDPARLPTPTAATDTARSLPRADVPTVQPARKETPADPSASLYDRVGGEAFFTELIAAFYRRVADDEVLRPLYPDADLGPAEERLRLFFIQYWGGPTTYSEQRGHPRLRMRHAPFPVGSVQIEAWLDCFREAIREVQPAPEVTVELWAYVERAAHFMRNVPEPS
ncbi:globin [Euzebya pacifica]|uniref:globin n=1 Tax=Euzebya pacifica TaxID=1608957 RepID=UPI0030FBEDF1